MGDLTKNFSRYEFECPCCGKDSIDLELVKELQVLRDFMGCPLRINSGIRCDRHNAAVGGSKRSQHLLGLAADVRIPEGQAHKMGTFILCSDFNGIGAYNTFFHLDLRAGTPRTWDRRTRKRKAKT